MTEQTAPRPTDRRSLGLMLLLTALGAVLVLTAVGRTWARGVVTGLDGGRLEISAAGSTLTGLPGGLALVALAAAVAVFAVRGRARTAVGVLTVLAGAGAAAGAVLGATDTAGLHTEAARKLALADAHAQAVTHSFWPWVALAGGVLLALAGLLTVRSGRYWPAMGARYEAPTAAGARPGKAAGAPRPASSPADLWKALDRGEDPTG
ncbi:TIGR02234 family membrane protein [Kitasatospora sp. NPDC094015]|uniref:TIGR02234 family membrane protein n=1 Tax=Kitasatospora sp. NPDC094015 TaxID=3155205 RepID=UPI00332FED56